MKVFISWSGPHARAVATALRGWLPLVIQSLHPWMSNTDIHAGERWADLIQTELEAAQFGIICVTPSNQMAPWLNFEAGALSKNVGQARVIPFVHGMTVPNMVPGPLKQFQAKEATREGAWDLIVSANRSLSLPINSDVLSTTFAAMWPRLEASLGEIELSDEEAELATRTPEQKVDEMLELLRETQSFEQEQLFQVSSDLSYIISALEGSGVLGPASLPVRLTRSSTMQVRAFLKPARFSVDEAAKTLTVQYDSRNEFHYKQVRQKIDQIQDSLTRVSGGLYTLVLIGPHGEKDQAYEDMPW